MNQDEINALVEDQLTKLKRAGLMNESLVRGALLAVAREASNGREDLEWDGYDAFLWTWSGVQFFPFDPGRAEIRIDDIAYALSHICRFGGHTDQFYSVAQHSVLVSRQLEGLCREAGLAGLLHDAQEAYMGDVIRPIKQHPGYAFYRKAEHCLQAAIFERFGVASWNRADNQKLIKHADNTLLATEKRDVSKTMVHPWENLPEPLGWPITAWSIDESRREFLVQFARLEG